MKKLFALVLALLILVMPVCVLAVDNVIIPPRPDIEIDVTDEVNTAFIEPNYYPDYDVAPAPMPAPEKASQDRRFLHAAPADAGGRRRRFPGCRLQARQVNSCIHKKERV